MDAREVGADILHDAKLPLCAGAHRYYLATVNDRVRTSAACVAVNT